MHMLRCRFAEADASGEYGGFHGGPQWNDEQFVQEVSQTGELSSCFYDYEHYGYDGYGAAGDGGCGWRDGVGGGDEHDHGEQYDGRDGGGAAEDGVCGV
jgi:hypothetical protein